jgi:hypothetical protein
MPTKSRALEFDVVVQAYNPSELGDRDRRIKFQGQPLAKE